MVGAAVGLALLTACGQPPTPAPSPGGGPGAVPGRLALFGAQPGDTSTGVLVLDLATGGLVRVGDQQEAWSAAWAGPDHIAVVRGPSLISAQGDVAGGLVVAAADGSDEGTPVGGVADVQRVAASADGQRLAFLGRTEPSSRACLDPAPAQPLGLYVAAGDGSGPQRVLDVPAATSSLTLSPDGRTAALLDMGDDTEIAPDRDWCAPGEVRLVLVDIATGTSRVVAGTTDIVGVPRWSPDGTTVVIAGSDFATLPARDLVFVDVATATARRLVTPDTVETAAVLSPDGQQLAVLRHTAGTDPSSTGTIAVGGADGTDLRTAVETGTEDHDLAWTPDGSHLVVVSSVITPLCGEAAAPGGEVSDTCDVATATTEVRVVGAAGGSLRQVSDAASWAEDGLAFAPEPRSSAGLSP